MSSACPSRRDDPWLRFVRGLVVVLVAMLERRIARLIWKYEYSPDGACDFAALDRKISRLEDLRDAYVAWLADPEAYAAVRAGGAPFRRPILARVRERSRGRRVALARVERAHHFGAQSS